MVTFCLILVLGFVPSFFFLLSPQLVADDCTMAPFTNQEKGVDEKYVWFHVVVLWQSLFIALFLASVAVLGHSTAACFLLFCAPTTNAILWTVVVRQDVLRLESDEESSYECWKSMLSQIFMFWMLTVVALVGSIMDKYFGRIRGGTDITPGNSSYERIP